MGIKYSFISENEINQNQKKKKGTSLPKKFQGTLFLLKLPFYCNQKHFGEHQAFILSLEVT